jgi:hypothetical protein
VPGAADELEDLVGVVDGPRVPSGATAIRPLIVVPGRFGALMLVPRAPTKFWPMNHLTPLAFPPVSLAPVTMSKLGAWTTEQLPLPMGAVVPVLVLLLGGGAVPPPPPPGAPPPPVGAKAADAGEAASAITDAIAALTASALTGPKRDTVYLLSWGRGPREMRSDRRAG